MLRRFNNIIIAPKSSVLLFNSSRTSSLLFSSRFASNNNNNPVDVENWTLDEAIVKRHQEIQEKWLKLSNDFSQMKQENNNAGILQAVDEGLKLYDQVGADDSPVRCRQMLWMTKAQAHLNRKEYEASYENANKAREEFQSSEHRAAADEGHYREIIEFIGFVQLERGKYKEALEIFDEMLTWVSEGSRKALPMVQVMAVNMKRTLQTGKARALYGLAISTKDADTKSLLNQSIDLLIDSLSAHVDEEDVSAAKMALDYATLCYCALGDLSKAEDACDKLEGWCKRNKDEAGLELAATRRAEIEELKKNKK
jgi:tetratricopeptide (TPR) repeat protein